VIILGIILALLGFFVGIPLLETLGIILIVIGAILMLVPIGGRTRRYY
jgi:uncharacterized membrane protein